MKENAGKISSKKVLVGLDSARKSDRLCSVMNRNELENVVLIVMIFLVLSMGVSLIKLAAVIGKVIFGA